MTRKKFTEEKNQQKKRGRYWFGIGPPTYEPSTSTAMKWARGDSPVSISPIVYGVGGEEETLTRPTDMVQWGFRN